MFGTHQVGQPPGKGWRRLNLRPSIAAIALVTFVVLKLTRVITWSWWWVLSPMWISGIITVLTLLLAIGGLLVMPRWGKRLAMRMSADELRASLEMAERFAAKDANPEVGSSVISRQGEAWRAQYYGPDGRERSKSFKRKRAAERWLVEQQTMTTRGTSQAGDDEDDEPANPDG